MRAGGTTQFADRVTIWPDRLTCVACFRLSQLLGLSLPQACLHADFRQARCKWCGSCRFGRLLFKASQQSNQISLKHMPSLRWQLLI